MNQEEKKFIYDFVHKHQIAVLATVAQSNNPEAAVIEFGETENLEIIFDTLTSYRKYQNLKSNGRVAFVIGWENDITLQYEGMAREIAGEEKEKCKQAYFLKNPDAEKWDSNSEIRYFKVQPKWIRYSNLNAKPWQVIELKFE